MADFAAGAGAAHRTPPRRSHKERRELGALGDADRKMLLAAGEGNRERAARIFETALHTPIGSDGKTLAHSLMKLGAR